MQQVSFYRAKPVARIDGGASAEVPQTPDPWRAVRRSLTGRWRLAIVLGLWCALIGAPLGWYSTAPVYRSEGLVRIASVLNGALMRLDAMVSVVVRILTGRRLLAWVSSSHLERGGMHFYRLDMYSYLAPGVALLGAIWLSMTRRGSVSGLGVLLLTAFWPVVVWLAHRIRKQPAVTHSR